MSSPRLLAQLPQGPCSGLPSHPSPHSSPHLAPLDGVHVPHQLRRFSGVSFSALLASGSFGLADRTQPRIIVDDQRGCSFRVVSLEVNLLSGKIYGPVGANGLLRG